MWGHRALGLAFERPMNASRPSMATEHPSTEGKWVVFDVGSERCAFPSPAIQEILPLPWLSRPPGLPPLMEGFFSLGGEVVPVVRLTRLLGLADVDSGVYTPLIVVRGQKGPLALLVDRVRDVRGLAEGTPAPVGEDQSFNGCIEAEVLIDDGVVHLLSPERLLLEEEARRIASLRDVEVKRRRLLESETA